MTHHVLAKTTTFKDLVAVCHLKGRTLYHIKRGQHTPINPRVALAKRLLLAMSNQETEKV